MPDVEFGSYYAAGRSIVNLRYPSAGETSGTLIRTFDAGIPVAVSDYAQFAEYPDECVAKISFAGGEVDALADFFLRDIESPAIAQREWLEKNARIEQTVEGYIRAVEDRRPRLSVQTSASIALFPVVEIVRAKARNGQLTITLRNAGTDTLRTRVYGQPGYRAIVKLMSGDREVQDRWIELPCDLRPNQTADVAIPLFADADSLRLFNALESIPIVDQEPAAVAEIIRV